ncbi:Profilin/allergen [Annulohypoxylon truncatum]|uniref:Profilin/allergen n=1 Tax=Annulohypoxylon truncatum TaxID=327061 RepID=UPI00200787D6|nr:Profilin/allergen [Annulohypoxylon truncatum]KAI1210023.1 Profilin/allergen [Annulohypoxylon truncatum]
MSWQAYVDSSLVNSGHLDKAAIISAAGDSVWATSAGFTVQPAEMKNLAEIVSGSKAAVDKAYADGLHVGGERYVATKIEDRSVYARQGRTGVVVVKTKQAILIGHYGETHIAGNAAQTTEALADYLIKVGY